MCGERFGFRRSDGCCPDGFFLSAELLGLGSAVSLFEVSAELLGSDFGFVLSTEEALLQWFGLLSIGFRCVSTASG